MLFPLTSKIIKYMKLEEQVTSLELSKRLKELGFKQDSLFYYEQVAIIGVGSGNEWVITGWEDKWILKYKREITDIISSKVYEGHIIYAYTVVELGEMLPSEIKKDGEWLGDLETNKNATTWVITYRKVGFNVLHIEKEKTEADARAKMLIYLKENNLI